MGKISLTLEQWLLCGAAVATVAFLGGAFVQPGVIDPDPDWEVSDGCLGGLERDGNGELVHRESEISEHYHPKLKITVDGQFLEIPGNTGIDQVGCREGMRWVHVHNAGINGEFTVLHVETPGSLNVPLGSFFEIWDREGGPKLMGPDDRKFDIDRNGVSDWEEYDISMTVNGDSNDKFEEYIMLDSDDIELILVSK